MNRFSKYSLSKSRKKTAKRKEAALLGTCKSCFTKPATDGYATCVACREYFRDFQKKFIRDAKEVVYNHYGRTCACCGESNIDFLTIDHVNNDGAKHRKALRNSLYRWLIGNRFPPDFRVLCYNCNCGKFRSGVNACPHTQFPNFVGDWEMATQSVVN